MNDQRLNTGIHRRTVLVRKASRAGRSDGGGSFTLTVSGGHGFVYCRLVGVNGGASLTIARDLVGLSSPADDDAPIWLEPDQDGNWNITARRWEGS